MEEIYAFIAADRPSAAARVAGLIKESIQNLSGFPLVGRKTQEANIRVLFIPGTPYLVYYHKLPDTIEIMAVFHGARRRFAE
jgi:toxin ParE1/3/4